MRAKVGAACTIVTVVALIAPAVAAGDRVLDRQTARGDFATTLVSGTLTRPARMRVAVSASPSQRVSVTWSILCTRGVSVSMNDGSRRGYAPFSVRLKHPMLKRASDCTASASVQLDDGGRLTARLLGRKR